MEFIYITNNPEIAAYVEDCGVDRIMVDLEYLDKKRRQKNRDTLISYHSLKDITKIRKKISHSKLQVRVNPINKNSKKEINEVLERGADIIMLPMFKYKWEVEKFLSLINNRARNSLLLETPQAMVRIEDILGIKRKINEVYIGLNDLSLGMGLDFMFELLSGGIVDYIVKKIKKRKIPFGFGGIGRFGTGIVDPRLILSEHVRLGSQIVILSRTFHERAQSLNELKKKFNFKKEIKKIRSYLSYLSQLPKKKLIKNKEKIRVIVSNYLEKKLK